ncbi:LOW QUALITY PROTEIN: hypothetical protein QC762_511843 [Podospora pseudocomata]|uniref:Uncharacterized protein n=1 Tax=Podospora pseudocomata TaxID=2093779 RepID=A0ABR0GBY5_9PEZI|nr:LOW QUALITY PROTEIN: hypothetical protein QC762_511843 [Podospora pseudocomata]
MASEQRLQKKRKAWKERKKAHHKATKAAESTPGSWKSLGVNLNPKPGEARPVRAMNMPVLDPNFTDKKSRSVLLHTEAKLDQIQAQLEKHNKKWTANVMNVHRQLEVEHTQDGINKKVDLVANVRNRLLHEINAIKDTIEGMKTTRANDFKHNVVEEMEENGQDGDPPGSEEEELVIFVGE